MPMTLDRNLDLPSKRVSMKQLLTWRLKKGGARQAVLFTRLSLKGKKPPPRWLLFITPGYDILEYHDRVPHG
jgi:hypothetical protein